MANSFPKPNDQPGAGQPRSMYSTGYFGSFSFSSLSLFLLEVTHRPPRLNSARLSPSSMSKQTHQFWSISVSWISASYKATGWGEFSCILNGCAQHKSESWLCQKQDGLRAIFRHAK